MVNFYVSSTFGAWRSPAARIVRDDEVAGSNPVAPTLNKELFITFTGWFSFLHS